MKLTVVGYYGGSPKANKACSSYILNVGSHNILLDCGPGSLSKIQEMMNLNAINDVIISHYHYDHFSDLGAFIYNRLVKQIIQETKEPLTIYTQKDDVFSPTFAMGEASQLYFIDENTELDIHGVKFTFIVTKHPVTCLAMKAHYKGRTLVYTADSAITESLKEFVRDADTLIIENSLYSGYDGGPAGHLNTEDVIEVCKASKASQVILTHLPIYGDHHELLKPVQKAISADVWLASDFLEVSI